MTATQTAPVLVRRAGDAVILVLNREPRLNCLDRPMAEALLGEVLAAARDRSVRAIALTGTGRAFCAGDDIAGGIGCRRGDFGQAPVCTVTEMHLYLPICEALLTAPKPVLAGINGLCAGAGTEIACAADYRLASARAGLGAMTLQVAYAANVAMLGRVVGPARATELFLTGRTVPAPQAAAMGLVDEVVEHESFDDRFAGLAARFASLPTAAVALFKDLRERTWDQPAVYALRLQDRTHHRNHVEVADGDEGIRAFLNGTPPVFTGR
ncbi:enoyl-CoA hydratase/isomerase family protein [Amycolatopsis anabasis]|uniref:enoyl-CoA hydratase/isomerase family protein n=1 Tax=Amycolatopsis anabasis TaxID=1840409 RepID=UPI00131D5FCC|nr:enoyl-CoA hydratase/isomerase family protein [Amycolatopsis anabasis]